MYVLAVAIGAPQQPDSEEFKPAPRVSPWLQTFHPALPERPCDYPSHSDPRIVGVRAYATRQLREARLLNLRLKFVNSDTESSTRTSPRKDFKW